MAVTYNVLRKDDKVLIVKADKQWRLPLLSEITFVARPSADRRFRSLWPIRVEAFDVADENIDQIPKGSKWVDLRTAYTMVPLRHYKAMAKSFELLHWDNSVCFCQKCGSPLQRATEISKRCPRCDFEVWPHLAPAIIVLIRKEDTALLVHAKTFSRPFYGLVAGFVETGESLEECVVREIREETSLRVKNIQYFGSQSWPFPSQLMIGFTADYVSGTLKFADNELTSGAFFTRDNLPQLPQLPSIARQLIDHWVKHPDSSSSSAGKKSVKTAK